MTTHPNACEERLDAHAFLWRPFHPPQFAAGDFMLQGKTVKTTRGILL